MDILILSGIIIKKEVMKEDKRYTKVIIAIPDRMYSYNSKTKEFEETHNYIIFKVFKPNREENKYLTKNNLVLIEGYLMGNCEKDGTTKTEIPEIFIKSIRCGAK